MRENLIKKFAEANLELKLEDDPILRNLGGADQQKVMFQLDIQKDKNGKERFRIYPGADTNIIQVTATDKSLQQVVLVVKENSVEFETELPYITVRHQKERHEAEHGEKWIDQMLREHRLTRRELVKVQGSRKGVPRVWVKMKTPEGRRNFLAGMDERNLFICQLPRMATSVKQAHGMLKNPNVIMAEGRLPGKTVRQGEWFFVNITPSEEAEISAAIKSGKAVIEKKCPIGVAVSGDVFRQGGVPRQRVGNPHTADEVLILSRETDRNGRRRDVYVRGAVRHVDHETVKFGSWRRVFRNMEANQGSAMSGLRYVD